MEGGRKMETRTAGWVQRIGIAALSFALAFLASGTAIASDIERQFPVIQDAAGSNVTVDISREGTRQTATPILTLNTATVRKIEDRVAKKADRLTGEIPSEETIAGALPAMRLAGSPRDHSAQPGTGISSRTPVPEEITVRSVKRFLKELRASRKEKQAPAVVVAPPEQRLGMADTSAR
jgi:hypothetical protein